MFVCCSHTEWPLREALSWRFPAHSAALPAASAHLVSPRNYDVILYRDTTQANEANKITRLRILKCSHRLTAGPKRSPIAPICSSWYSPRARILRISIGETAVRVNWLASGAIHGLDHPPVCFALMTILQSESKNIAIKRAC